jgi:hypothetical protein
VAFSNGQNVQAADLNNLSIVTLALSGGQVGFPAVQNPSTDPNTLDDYEEGSWTPVIGGSGGTSGQAYTRQIGRYIKIGKLVVCWFNVLLSTEGTITGSAEIQGLPFTSLNVSNFFGVAHVQWFGLPTNLVFVGAEVSPNTTAATLFGATAAAGSLAALTAADIDDNSQFVGLVAYIADA